MVIGDLQLTPEAQTLVDQSKNSSTKVLFQKTDVSDWKQLESLFTFTEKELGIPDVVGLAAGLFEPVSISRKAAFCIFHMKSNRRLPSVMVSFLERHRRAELQDHPSQH